MSFQGPIAEAERRRDTEIKTASATREGQKARLEAETEIAQSERDKKIKLESYRAEQDKAKANADVAYKLQEAENNMIYLIPDNKTYINQQIRVESLDIVGQAIHILNSYSI